MLKLNALLMLVFALLAVMVRADTIEDEMNQTCGNLPQSKTEEIRKKCAPEIASFIIDPVGARSKMITCMKNECQNQILLIVAICAGALCLVGMTVYCCMKRRNSGGRY